MAHGVHRVYVAVCTNKPRTFLNVTSRLYSRYLTPQALLYIAERVCVHGCVTETRFVQPLIEVSADIRRSTEVRNVTITHSRLKVTDYNPYRV